MTTDNRIRVGGYMTAVPCAAGWEILSRDKEPLGVVEWFGRWKQYVFVPEFGALFSWDCLRDLSTFITQQNKERRT